jgi:glycosyltransferase involved in cell wall biosynthesis
VSKQSYPNIEIIVSDNASPGDATEKVIDSFVRLDSRVKHFRQAINIGAISNFAFVLTQAKGQLFMWFADDDTCDQTFVAELVACFLNDPTIALAMSDVRVVEASTSHSTNVFLSSIRRENSCNWDRSRRLFFSYPTTNIFFCIYGLYRTDMLRRCKFNYVSRWKNIIFASELPVLAQIASQGKIVSVPKILKTYVSHADSAYVKERKLLKRFDRMFRHLEIRTTLSWIAMQSHLKLREKMPLVVQPWMSWTL